MTLVDVKIDTFDTKFTLDVNFLRNFVGKQPDWGPLGYITFKRTYARKKSYRTEEFWETLQRVVEGVFNILKDHCYNNGLPWDDEKAQKEAQIMYQKMWDFKMLPPGRGLWLMGTKIVDRIGSMGLNNCGFVSTKMGGPLPFVWTMDALMLGVGIGFDTSGEMAVVEPKGQKRFIIPDSREGWTAALQSLLEAYFYGEKYPIFDFSEIRAKGEPINGFGGVASGPAPLKEMLHDIDEILRKRVGGKLSSVDILDIMNLIGKCVVAGNVRRSAQIALGDINDDAYIMAKQDEEALYHHRWASNNSIIAYDGTDYRKIADMIKKNGEPGIIWLDNARAYSRMGYPADWKDIKAVGVNPCFSGDECLLCHVDGKNVYRKLSEIDNVEVVTPTGLIVNGKVWCSGEKETIKLIFSNSALKHEMIVTPDHVFKTADGRDVEAKDLLGERVRIHKDPVYVHDEKWVKLGFIQGDGNLTRLNSKKHKGIEINIGKKDDDVLKLFGFEKKGRSYYTTEFTDDLLRYGFDAKVLPERQLPKIIEDKRSFLRGLWSANGSVIKGKRISFKTTSKILVEQLRVMLDELGIDSYITTNKEKDVKFSNGTYRCKESYDLNIVKIYSIAKFYEEIGFIHNYKNKDLMDLLIKRSPKVISIKKWKKTKVYDFSAPGVNWGFVNGVVVHNCGEQTLESFELCTLVETFPSRHETYEEFEETLHYAYMYAKSVTLVGTHWNETNAVIGKNRRIGVSQTGIIDAFAKHGRKKVLNWCDRGYEFLKQLDEKFSAEYGVPKSIKITTVKPSGTVSLLPGVSPGIHYPHAEYYIRRIRIAKNSELIDIVKDAGYHVEDDAYSDETCVVEFPVHEENYIKGKNEVTVWEQIANAIDYQHYWSDNQVSITVTFKKDEDIVAPLEFAEDKLKGISLLPLATDTYKQMPYEEITKEQYEEMVAKLKPLYMNSITEEGEGVYMCDGVSCQKI